MNVNLKNEHEFVCFLGSFLKSSSEINFYRLLIVVLNQLLMGIFRFGTFSAVSVKNKIPRM
jgi:hypothetical protein